eukprot:10921707-Heterocapsa_arctica.AAC.1
MDHTPEEQRAAAAVGLTRKSSSRSEEAHMPMPQILIVDEPDQEAPTDAHIPAPQILIVDEPDQEAPTEDRPNPHAG